MRLLSTSVTVFHFVLAGNQVITQEFKEENFDCSTDSFHFVVIVVLGFFCLFGGVVFCFGGFCLVFFKTGFLCVTLFRLFSDICCLIPLLRPTKV